MNEKLINYQAAVLADAAEGEKLGYLCQLIHIYNTHVVSIFQSEKAIAFTLSSGGWLFNQTGGELIFDNTGTLEQLILIVEGLLDEICI